MNLSLDAPPATNDPQRPPAAGDPRPSGVGPVLTGLVVIAVALVLVLGVAMAILLADDEPEGVATEVEPAPTVPTPEPAPAGAPAPVELGTDADDLELSAESPTPTGIQQLSLRGMGSVLLGMTVDEVEQVLGTTLDFSAAGSDGCYYATDPTDVVSPDFMVLSPTGDPSGGEIVRIELGVEHSTRSGLHIGSTKADVLAAYGDRIEATPHPYDGSPGSEYLTYVPADAADAEYRLILETSADRVVAIRAGLLPAVLWIEGCS